MNSPSVLQRLASDAPKTFYDLAFDEDHEVFIHLGEWRRSEASHRRQKPSPGLLGFLAGFIWFMNSKWSWQEVLTMLDSMLSVLLEGA
jgi:hypothetical protein